MDTLKGTDSEATRFKDRAQQSHPKETILLLQELQWYASSNDVLDS